MYHISMVKKVRDMLMDTYQSCVQNKGQKYKDLLWMCGIDQIHFSLMKEHHPEMFFKVGYGKITVC